MCTGAIQVHEATAAPSRNLNADAPIGGLRSRGCQWSELLPASGSGRGPGPLSAVTVPVPVSRCTEESVGTLNAAAASDRDTA